MQTLKSIDINVLIVSLHQTSDGEKFLTIKDDLDNNSIMIFDDEIDSLIDVLQNLKKDL